MIIFQGECGKLWCTPDGKWCDTRAAPALDGTPCGSRNVSRHYYAHVQCQDQTELQAKLLKELFKCKTRNLGGKVGFNTLNLESDQ